MMKIELKSRNFVFRHFSTKSEKIRANFIKVSENRWVRSAGCCEVEPGRKRRVALERLGPCVPHEAAHRRSAWLSYRVLLLKHRWMHKCVFKFNSHHDAKDVYMYVPWRSWNNDSSKRVSFRSSFG